MNPYMAHHMAAAYGNQPGFGDFGMRDSYRYRDTRGFGGFGGSGPQGNYTAGAAASGNPRIPHGNTWTGAYFPTPIPQPGPWQPQPTQPYNPPQPQPYSPQQPQPYNPPQPQPYDPAQ